MGPTRVLGIYIGYDSGSIIRYLEPHSGEVFKARFHDSIFDETLFPKLQGGSNEQRQRDLDQILSISGVDTIPTTGSALDPRT